jgi:hypothetical protein
MSAETQRAIRLRAMLVGFLVVWLAVVAVISPLDYDEAVYSIVAKGMVQGEWPYRDLFDHKPPLVYVWHLPIALSGSIALQRLFAVALVVASLGVLVLFARRRQPPLRVSLIAASYVAFLANPFIGTGTSAESYMLLPLVAAVAVPSAAGSGALLAVALLTKPTAIFFLPILLWRWRGASWRTLAALGACVAVVCLAFRPIWPEFWEANVSFNREFSARNAGSTLELAWHLVTIHPQAVIGALPIWIAAVAGALRFRSLDEDIRVWGVCALLAVKANTLAGRGEYAHYYILLAPPMAFFAATGFEHMGQRIRLRRLLYASGLVSTVLFAASLPLLVRTRTQYNALVDAIARTDGEVYGIGSPPQLYPYAGRVPERRFFFENPLIIREDWRDATKEGLQRCTPDALVLARDLPDELMWADELRSSYQAGRRFGDLDLLIAPLDPCPDARDAAAAEP